MIPLFLMFHILGIALWAGGLLSVAVLLAQQAKESGEARAAIAQTAKKLLLGMANPGAALTAFAGVGLVSLNTEYYLHARWFYTKLGFVALLVGLHGWAGVRVNRTARGRSQLTSGDAWQMFWMVALTILMIAGATMFGRLYLP